MQEGLGKTISAGDPLRTRPANLATSAAHLRSIAALRAVGYPDAHATHDFHPFVPQVDEQLQRVQSACAAAIESIQQDCGAVPRNGIVIAIRAAVPYKESWPAAARAVRSRKESFGEKSFNDAN
jgi:hypothetical protein